MPTLKEIAHEWNLNARARCRQLHEGRDISHDKVLVPMILQLAGDLHGKTVLDVGCGCGCLAAMAARYAKAVIAIDVSKRMIQEATRRHAKPIISFKLSSLEALAREGKGPYDICLSNMTIITMPNLKQTFREFASILEPGGLLIFSVAHPCFWNIYRNDEPFMNFNYWRPHAVRAPFRITLDPKPLPAHTTYFHRPLSMYLSSMTHAGFHLDQVVEPKPPKGVPKAYGQGFRLPRFIVFRARKS